MKIKILSENDNKLFHRKEVSFNANHDSAGTPDKSSIYTYFAAKLKSPKNNMILKRFNTRFGAHSTEGVLYIYDNDKEMSKVETKNLIERRDKVFKAEEEAAAKEAEAKAAPAEPEAPAETTEDSAEEAKSEETPVTEEASE